MEELNYGERKRRKEKRKRKGEIKGREGQEGKYDTAKEWTQEEKGLDESL